MKKIALFMALVSTFALCNNLDDLLAKIKQESINIQRYNSQKEAKFLQEKNRQEEILQALKVKISSLEKQNQKNEALYESQNQEIASLKNELSLKSVNLDELFGVAKQAANDLYANAKTSLLRAEYPLENEFLSLVNSKTLPNAKELETLWTSYLKEIINSGKISAFDADVILKDGSKTTLHTNRIGIFTAFNEKGFFDFQNGALLAYPKQPTQYLKYAKTLIPNEGFKNIIIDPTKGSLLNIESLKPDIKERIRQAGSVGYVIIFLGIFGLLIALFQFIRLFIIKAKIKKQMKNLQTLKNNNPLGRVLLSLENEKEEKNLKNKLNQAVLKENAKISTIKSFVKLLASVAPMLGLLGTVIGMIATFQAITLFGTGEPQLMAGGISQALITTVLGLVVAIPLLFFYAILNAKSQNILQIIYEQSMGLMIQRTK